MNNTGTVLNMQEAAAMLGYTLKTLRKKCSRKEIPHYKPTCKKIFFDAAELEEWIRSHRVASNEELQRKAQNY